MFLLEFFQAMYRWFFWIKIHSHCNSVRSAIMISEDHAIQVLYLKTNVLLLEWQMLWMLVTDQRSYINRPRCQFISIALDVNSRIVWCLLSCFPVHLPPWHLSALLRGHIVVRFSFSLFAYLFSVTRQYRLAFDVCSHALAHHDFVSSICNSMKRRVLDLKMTFDLIV